MGTPLGRTTVKANDADEDNLTYSLGSGRDASFFRHRQGDGPD